MSCDPNSGEKNLFEISQYAFVYVFLRLATMWRLGDFYFTGAPGDTVVAERRRC
jgi:hypothetical protein